MRMTCEKCRNKSNGMVKLRHQCYQCYLKDQHCMTETPQKCMRMLEDSEKTNQRINSKVILNQCHIFFFTNSVEALPTVENDNNIE